MLETKSYTVRLEEQLQVRKVKRELLSRIKNIVSIQATQRRAWCQFLHAEKKRATDLAAYTVSFRKAPI